MFEAILAIWFIGWMVCVGHFNNDIDLEISYRIFTVLLLTITWPIYVGIMLREYQERKEGGE